MSGIGFAEFQTYLVLILVVLVFVAFIRETIAPDIVILSAVAVLLITGVLKSGEVLAVFSNAAPITIACMFVLSAALERTGVIDAMGRHTITIGQRAPKLTVAILMLCVFAMSAFINNTPVVVIMTPVVIALARSIGLSSSKLLIPLSFVAILGGTSTLIGTSTNLLVDGVVTGYGMPGMGMFEMTLPALIMGGIGLAYLALIGRHLLPDRESLATVRSTQSRRRFLTEVVVSAGSKLIDQPLNRAKLDDLHLGRVVDVIRDDVSLRHELKDITLRQGDRLVIKSELSGVMGLKAAGQGALRDLTDAAYESEGVEPVAQRETILAEGIVGPHSGLVGCRIADRNLRRRFGVYILAVHRQNQNLQGNFETVRLAFGDTLLMEGPVEGINRLFATGELINLTEPQTQPHRHKKAPIAGIAIIAVVALAALEVMPIAALAMIAATAVVLFKCVDAEEAYRAIEWRILMLIFGTLALSAAMDKTGAAALVVEGATQALAGMGPWAALCMIYLITSLITEMVSNNATAVLIAPIAVGIAHGLGVDPRPFALAVMFAASNSFATPIGYQTNTFVYGAGGYKFMDFVKIGLPMNILIWITGSIVIPWWWPFDGQP